MDVLLVDLEEDRKNLLPFTFTRPVSEVRVGILTIAEKWKKRLDGSIHYLTSPYLQKKFSNTFRSGIVVNASICPSQKLIAKINELQIGESLYKGDTFIATRAEGSYDYADLSAIDLKMSQEYHGEINSIRYPWDIFHYNSREIQRDFEFLTRGRESAPINDPHTVVYGQQNVFLESGANVKAAILNAENGPIYLGPNSVVHEGAIIKGSFALGEGGHVNMGAKIKGDSTIGPFSKVGGEVSNSVIFGYSNKAHDGFLGNSVIAEWCNLGADTNTSNLKNNYDEVKLWNYNHKRFQKTGLQFCGLMMGDHAKSGINTMFNTGTVVGVGANVFGGSFPRNFIPSFSWGGSQGFTTFQLEKFFATAEKVMRRRGVELPSYDEEMLSHIFDLEKENRYWENS